MKYVNKFESFIGNKAAITTGKKRKYAVAIEMEKRGARMQKIFLATGWFRNKYDTRWRYENADNSIAFRDIPYDSQIKKLWTSLSSYPFYLKDIIYKTSLFKEYPQLEKVIVYLNVRGIKQNASFNGSNLTITLNGVKYLKEASDLNWELIDIELLLSDEVDKDKIIDLQSQYNELKNKVKEVGSNVFVFTDAHKSALMHEIQHAIQFIESFPSGSSPKLFSPTNSVYNSKTKTYRDFTDMEMYRNTTGEIEAREVQRRLDLPPTAKIIAYDGDKDIVSGFIKYFDSEQEAKDFMLSSKDNFVLDEENKKINKHKVYFFNMKSRKETYPYEGTVDKEDGIVMHWSNDSEDIHNTQIKKGL